MDPPARRHRAQSRSRRAASAARRWAKRCICWPTGPGPPPPGLVRRVTATPGVEQHQGSRPRAGWASTSSASGTRRSRESRTRPPTRRGPAGTACPRRPATRPGRRPPCAGRVGRRLHPGGVEGGGGQQPAQGREGPADLVEGVEERLLVLLQVPVVGEREPLQGRQQAGQVADQPARLAPGQLGDVGVLLLGQHRAAGGVGVVEAEEAELLASTTARSPPRAGTGGRRAGPGRRGPRPRSRGRTRRRASSRTGPAKPRSSATPSGSRGSDEPARAPAPRGETSRRRRVSRAGRRRGPAPSRGPAGGGPAAPAGPVAGGCTPAGRRRRPARARRRAAPLAGRAPGGRWRRAPAWRRGAGRWRPGRCGCGRCAAWRPRRRPAR